MRKRKPNKWVAALAVMAVSLYTVTPAFPQASQPLKVTNSNGAAVPVKEGAATGSVSVSPVNDPATAYHFYRTNAIQARLNGGNTAFSGVLDLTGANHITLHAFGTADSACGKALCFVGFNRLSAALVDSLNRFKYWYRDTMTVNGAVLASVWSDTIGTLGLRDSLMYSAADTIQGIGEIPLVLSPATIANRGITFDLQDRSGKDITAGLCVFYVRMAKFWTGNPSWTPINPYTGRSASISIDVEGTR